MWRIFAGLLAALAFVAALATGAVAQSSYKIHVGDTLSLEVLEDSSLNRPLLVLPDGSVSVPLVGSVPAAGRTLDDLRASVIAGLSPNFAAPPTVFVSVAKVAARTGGGTRAPATISIYLNGQINKPGMVDVAPGTTLLQALAIGGGLTKFGAPKRIKLLRVDSSGKTVVYQYDYKAAISGVSQPSIVLQSGDVIAVPTRGLFE